MFKTLITTLLISVLAANSEVSKAILSNDSKSFSAYFSQTVELDILGIEGNYSKAQAEQIIKKFFTEHPISSYKVMHTGSAKDGSSFEIGTAQSKQNTYRTYLLLKGTGVNQKIHQFRVEEENE